MSLKSVKRMANQDRLHQWWLNKYFERNSTITIKELSDLLEPGRAGLRHAVHRKVISDSGWNYAVLKFLIEYCYIPQSILDIFKVNANPKGGNYAIWRKYPTIEVSVKK